MNPFVCNKQIDLVDFEDLKLFMFKHDNLYDIAIPKARKNQSLAQYQEFIRQHGYPRSMVSPENVTSLSQARFGAFFIMHHLWQHGVDFTVLDIGSHIGDFSLKMGNCIRTFGQANRVIAFDPTEAGALMDYNIELNGLGKIVKHEDLAVSEFDGLMLFDYSPGFSDSAHIVRENYPETRGVSTRLHNFWCRSLRGKAVSIGKFLTLKLHKLTPAGARISSYNLIVRGVDILSYLEQHDRDEHLFVKIDIEGFDSVVINRLLQLLPTRLVSIIFEFAPSWSLGGFEQAGGYLRKLGGSFHLFDLFYSPNPTRFNLITPSEIGRFVDEVSQRAYGYTDVFLLDKRIAECDQLVHRLSSLVAEPDRMVL
jgi:FkbM family methyltransferase